ncbi:MAG: transglutaminase-like cysteine peptidase [Sphingobium sp.]
MTSTCRVSVYTAIIVAGLALSSPSVARGTQAAFIPAGDVADAPSGFVEMCARDAVLCRAGIAAEPARHAVSLPSSFVSLPPSTHAKCAPSIRATPSMMAVSSFVVQPTHGQEFGASCAVLQATTLLPASDPIVASSSLNMDSAQELTSVKSINSEVNRAIRPMADYQTTGTDERWDRPGRGKYLVGDCEDFAIEKRMRLIEAGFSSSKLFYAVAYVKGYGMHIVLIARLASGDVVLDNISPHVMPWDKVKYSWLRVQSTQDPMVWRRIGAPSTGNQVADSGRATVSG